MFTDTIKEGKQNNLNIEKNNTLLFIEAHKRFSLPRGSEQNMLMKPSVSILLHSFATDHVIINS